MPVTIVETVGGASSNAFVTLVELTSYMDGRLNASAFDSATTDTKNRAIVEATRELSSRQWKGTRASDTQALAWPRQWVENPDAATATSYYDTDEIPQRVKDATMELAFQFINAGTTDLAAMDGLAGVVSKTVDVLSTTYAVGQRPQGLRRFPRVWSLIAPLLANGIGVTVPVVRG